jgi:hypothetical protein
MNYFSKLFQYNKWLGPGMVVYAVITVAANLTKLETTPAFIWGMYSEKEASAGSYPVLKIVINDSILLDYSSGFPDPTRFYLLFPLQYYLSMKDNKYVDPEEDYYREKLGKYFHLPAPVKKNLFNDSMRAASFMKWYAGYLEAVTQTRVRTLEIGRLDLKYNREGRPELQQESTLLKWNRP